MKALRAVNNYLASATLTLAMLIIFIMVTALFLSAATRFITGTGFAWFIELPPVLVSWLVLETTYIKKFPENNSLIHACKMMMVSLLVCWESHLLHSTT